MIIATNLALLAFLENLEYLQPRHRGLEPGTLEFIDVGDGHGQPPGMARWLRSSGYNEPIISPP